MSISRLTNSFFSATNENNFSLGNLNVDFSLVQIAAPKEYEPLASALSTHRRVDAEEGQPHRTAGRLGALFEDVIPSTPNLIKAFGHRVSQILQTPDLNPKGDSTHGPFEKFVGADGTTLWAAATSGVNAIGVYLLSCLLAQAWESKEATALWVELVKQRQTEILTAFGGDQKVSFASLCSARQDIAREDLARWDNSARSWLRSANRARVHECQQLLLITKNLELPIATTNSTYADVMRVWKEAMIGLEALLCGHPVEVSSGSLFLAFSSWYLFPDLIVLGTTPPTHVQFRDALFPPGGRCTVRPEYRTGEDSGGIRWSLTLSHLRYYGDPVVVENDPDTTRVTIRDLMLAVLGYLFKEWQISDRDNAMVAKWLVDLWNLVKTDLEKQKESDDEQNAHSPFGWLSLLATAANDSLATEPKVKLKNLQLLRFGRRRGRVFSVGGDEILLPFFWICNPMRLTALCQTDDTECGIKFLRELAQRLRLSEGNAIISHAIDGHEHDEPGTVNMFQHITAIPHTRQTKKRDCSGGVVYEHIHARWLIRKYAYRYQVTLDEIKNSHSNSGYTDQSDITLWTDDCHNKGEFCASAETGYAKHQRDYDWLTWKCAPPIFACNSTRATHSSKTMPVCTSAMASPDVIQNCNCFLYSSSYVKFRAVFGDWRLGLYVLETENMKDSDYVNLNQLALSLTKKSENVALSISKFSQADVNPHLVSNYLSMITRCADDSKQDPRYAYERDKMLKRYAAEIYILGPSLPISFCQTMVTLELAAKVYENLRCATIALTVLSESLIDDEWVPRPICSPLEYWRGSRYMAHLQPYTPSPMTRQEVFSCVAKLESGTVNLDPEDLDSTLALCSDNSMFVAAVALLDPFETPAAHELRHIVGNIGHPGISLLVAPEEPKIRNRSNHYTAVTHAPYDFERENNFEGTTLHLSFTDWRFPLEAGGSRTIDKDVLVVESVISVLDRGKWVADLDILCIEFEALSRITKDCTRHDQKDHDFEFDYIGMSY